MLTLATPPLIVKTITFILQTPRRMHLRRIIRQSLPLAIKRGPQSVEWDFVAKWSFELRMLEIR